MRGLQYNWVRDRVHSLWYRKRSSQHLWTQNTGFYWPGPGTFSQNLFILASFVQHYLSLYFFYFEEIWVFIQKWFFLKGVLVIIRYYVKLRWYQTKKILPGDWRLLPNYMLFEFVLEIVMMILIPNPFMMGTNFKKIENHSNFKNNRNLLCFK